MKVLNRFVVILRPKIPYAEWANSVDRNEPHYVLEEHRTEGNAYLLPELGDDTGKQRLLRRFYQTMFEQELSGWMEDKTCWPLNRDWKTFQTWFDIEWRSMVIDLAPGGLEIEEM